MPSVPKSLFVLGASALAFLRARRWCREGQAVPQQQLTWKEWTTRAATTAYGHQHGIEAGMRYSQFQDRVPPRSYETLVPWIELMKRGEADVLWPGYCADYAITAGTTTGQPKELPVTPAMLQHFRQAGLDALLMYTVRTGSSRIFRGRHLLLGGAAPLLPLVESPPCPRASNRTGRALPGLPEWAERHFYEPGRDIAQISDWPAKLHAIAARCSAQNITLLAGLPNWLLTLAEAVREYSRAQNQGINQLGELWPNLECLIHGGIPLTPFADELRRALGPGVNLHEVYPAAEGFIAAQDTCRTHGLRLLTGAGLFFEFLPLSAFDASRLEHLGHKVVPLAEVRVGLDYALLLTTPAGLCRYVLGDVVRFLSTEPPRLLYVGRTQLQLQAFSEHVTEKELTDSLTAVCTRHTWSVVNFHVAPLFSHQPLGPQRGRHEWWVELRPGTKETPTGPILEVELDAELQRLNVHYAARRQNGELEPPIVRLVIPCFFAQWLQQQGKWGGHHKMPRCRSDRTLADAFAQKAQFNR